MKKLKNKVLALLCSLLMLITCISTTATSVYANDVNDPVVMTYVGSDGISYEITKSDIENNLNEDMAELSAVFSTAGIPDSALADCAYNFASSIGNGVTVRTASYSSIKIFNYSVINSYLVICGESVLTALEDGVKTIKALSHTYDSSSHKCTNMVYASGSATDFSIKTEACGAEEPVAVVHKHCVCGKTDCSGTGHDGNTIWTGIGQLSDITGFGNYYLTANVTLENTWGCDYNVNLCLNGFDIIGADTSYVINIIEGRNITITDCQETSGKIIYNKDAEEDSGTYNNILHTQTKSASDTEEGNIEYGYSSGYEKYFSDENAKNEIELKDTLIAKLAPSIIKGDGQSITEGEKKALEFTSDAEFDDFIRVEIDGKTIDESNYTVKSGSTVVTLKADYVATILAGEHTLGIVSQSETAMAKFTVNKKTEETTTTTDKSTANDKTKSTQTTANDKTKSSQTDDNSNIVLWIALPFVSGGAVAATLVCKKRKYKR